MTHYLPHRPVVHGSKIRAVYDASARTKSGSSLNDILYKGPAPTEDVVALLLNFRLFDVGVTADIEKAFHQILLNEVDRDVTRFLWVNSLNAAVTPENLVVFRFLKLPFGVNASPFLLNMVIKVLPQEQLVAVGQKPSVC